MARATPSSRSLTLNWHGHSINFKREWAIFAAIIAVGYWLWKKVAFRWGRLAWYHPYNAAVLAVLIVAWLIGLDLLVGLCGALCVAWGLWAVKYPTHYRKWAVPRFKGFLWASRYRPVFGKKLDRCGLRQKGDPKQALLRAEVHGCTVKVLSNWVDGNSIDDYHNRADRIAPAFNAQDCKIKLVRKDGEPKPRLIEMEMLQKNPFRKVVGAEWIDFYRDDDLLNTPVAMTRNGAPYRAMPGNTLLVAETGGGKSNAIRCRAYADHPAIMAGLMAWWVIDLKGGVEGSVLEHICERVCYGDDYTTASFNPQVVDQFLKDAVAELDRRKRQLRDIGDDDWDVHKHGKKIRIVIDELLALTGTYVDPYRASIAGSIEILQQQDRAFGIELTAAVQDPRKRKLDFRDGFTRREGGRMGEKDSTNMALGAGAWERGAKCDMIDPDQPGIFYAIIEGDPQPQEIRYPRVTKEEIQALTPIPEPAQQTRPPLGVA